MMRICATEETEAEARERLGAILNDKVMLFNPYTVGDEALVACAERGRWRQFPALTQMVVFHFLDIRTVVNKGSFYALFYRVGDSEEEYYFPLGRLIYSISHHATKKPERIHLNGRNIVRSNVERLQGRNVFVSHSVTGTSGMSKILPAFKMWRLDGNLAQQAALIRQSMWQSKIMMLEDVLRYASSPCYLGHGCNAFDYATPIHSALHFISHYPDAAPPLNP